MRTILYTLVLTLASCSLGTPSNATSSAGAPGSADSLEFVKLVEKVATDRKASMAPDSAIVMVALHFQGIPYVAHTLEADGPEQLVVNLREMDCTTFVETVLAISWCLKSNKTSYADFKEALTRLRYRQGVIDQYPSRLHYFSDWMVDNQQKGLVELVSEQFGPSPYSPRVGFMGKNPDKYKALAQHPEFVPVIRQQESVINGYQLKFIPKADVPKFEKLIRNGDVIAITTSIAGLDIAHVGLALHRKGRLHFIHASTSMKKVVVSDKPLADYLASIPSHTGILVGRMK